MQSPDDHNVNDEIDVVENTHDVENHEEEILDMIKHDNQDVYNKLNEEERLSLERTFTKTVERRMRFSGPLPHPEHLRQYAEVYEGAPKEIFEMARKQMEHRHEIEIRESDLRKSIVNKSSFNNNLGVILGFILALTFVIGGLTLIAIDKAGYGFTVIAGVIVSLVSIVTIRKIGKQDSSEDENESEDDKQESK